MGDLEKMQAEVEKLMPEIVYIQKLVKTKKDTGGWSEIWQSFSTVKGRLGSLGRDAYEHEVAGRIVTQEQCVVTLPASANVDQNCQLQIAGHQYEIIGMIPRSGKTAQRCICVEVI